MPVYTYVEQMPVFPGGQEALLQTLGHTIYYPTEALEKRLEGRVFVQFVVGVTGTVQDVKVSMGTHPLLDAEAVRAVEKLPAFAPGRQAGKPVPVAYTVPITFKVPANVKDILAARATAALDAQTRLANFPGGPEALRTYLSNQPLPASYRPPAAAARAPRVFVSFDVDSTGVISNIEAVQPLPLTESRRLHQRPAVPAPDAALLTAAVTLVGAMPAWEPAVLRGKRVSTHHTEPVTFGPTGPALSYAEQMPVFSQPVSEMQYTGRQLRYPVSALRNQTQGAVLLYYEVSEEGKLENLEVIRSVSPDVDAEAVRVYQANFPSYQPARHQGKPVRVFFVVPTTFAIK